MNKRSTTEWQALFEQHAASGLSAAAFCREQGLCSNYFSLRRKQLSGELSDSIRKKPKPQARVTAFVTARFRSDATERIAVRFGEIEIHSPRQVDVNWLSDFVVALRV